MCFLSTFEEKSFSHYLRVAYFIYFFKSGVIDDVLGLTIIYFNKKHFLFFFLNCALSSKSTQFAQLQWKSIYKKFGKVELMELFISYPKLERKSHHCPLFFLHPRGRKKGYPGPRKAQEKVNTVLLKVHLLPGRSEGPHGSPGPGRRARARARRRRPWCWNAAGQKPSGCAGTARCRGWSWSIAIFCFWFNQTEASWRISEAF